MNLGIDFHDTISYKPEFFKQLMETWDGDVYIITGTPASKKEETITQLRNIGITDDLYVDILMGYEYKKEDMTFDHFNRMKEHKLNHIKNHNIQVYFDDNPFYINHMRNNGVLTFQTVLSNEYLDEFENKHNFFTCNLQRNQFDYLKKHKKDNEEK